MEFRNIIDTQKSVLQRIELKDWKNRGIEVSVKRDDLLDEAISGNKWRKLYYNLQQALHQKSAGIFTFGGAYSNHLLAVAKACSLLGIPSLGFVRGEELTPASNHTLEECSAYGMKLEFLSRELYRLRNDKMFIDELKTEYPAYYAIPEGGANFYGMIGCQEIWKELPGDIDHVFVAQGTTTTSCGLLMGAGENTTIHAVPVLKGFEVKETMQKQLVYALFDEELTDSLLERVCLHDTYHFGGYGKYTEELLTFIQQIYAATGIPLDPVYTAKAFFAMYNELEQPCYDGQKVLFYHSGGIQGCKSVEEKEKIRFFHAG